MSPTPSLFVPIFNVSFSSGIFPSEMKTAKVIPLPAGYPLRGTHQCVLFVWNIGY